MAQKVVHVSKSGKIGMISLQIIRMSLANWLLTDHKFMSSTRHWRGREKTKEPKSLMIKISVRLTTLIRRTHNFEPCFQFLKAKSEFMHQEDITGWKAKRWWNIVWYWQGVIHVTAWGYNNIFHKFTILAESRKYW